MNIALQRIATPHSQGENATLCESNENMLDFHKSGAKVMRFIGCAQATCTAYTDTEYQRVTSQVPYTGGYTDTYTGRSFNKL